MSEDIEEDLPGVLPRFFVNNIDTFLSGTLAQHLAICKPGNALDEEDEVGEEVEETLIEPEPPLQPKLTGYRIVGTLSRPDAQPPTYVNAILKYEDRRDFYEELFECDCIIYDITSDASQAEEALWVAKSLANDLERIEKQKTFILVTHLLSWARSKFDHELNKHPTFEEEDHPKRKPHPLYKQQFNTERSIFKLGKKHKKQLTTYVIACGIPYGGREDIFEQFFLKAWMNSRELEVYGDGKNIVPTIHVKDLARIVQATFEGQPGSRYIVAKDRSRLTLGAIIEAISKEFGTGEIRHLNELDIIRNNNVPQVHIDQLMMDIVVTTPTVDEEIPIPWKCEDGIIANIGKLAKEYVAAKQFTPLRICVLGAPFVGKTTYAIALARHYGLHYIHISPVLHEAYVQLRTPITVLEQLRMKDEREAAEKLKKEAHQKNRVKSPPLLPTATSQDISDDQLSSDTIPPSDAFLTTNPFEDTAPPSPLHSKKMSSKVPEIIEESEATTSAEKKLLESLPEEIKKRYPFYPPLKWTNKQELEKIAKSAEAELRQFISGMKDDYHAEDHIIVKYLRRKLLSKPCQNQGFVLDGWPVTFEQTEALFRDQNDRIDDPRHPTYDPLITPHHIIYLMGSNFLVIHRFKLMMEQKGINLDEIGDYDEIEGLTLDLEEEVYKRKSMKRRDQGGKYEEYKNKKKEQKIEDPKRAIDLKIAWLKQAESPVERLRRRLETHRSAMAPKSAKDILEKTFAPFSYLVKHRKNPVDLEPPPWPRKPLANAVLDPLEKNVLAYFDLRELHPFIVDMDHDKSQHLYPSGPQKATFKRILERISKSPTGTFVRRTKEVLNPGDGDENFIQNLEWEAWNLKEFEDNFRKEARDVLIENEKKIWDEWLTLLKREYSQRQVVSQMPRRDYLIKYVLPKVSECLVIFGQRRPSDPVEFLAEYLLRDVGFNSSGNIH